MPRWLGATVYRKMFCRTNGFKIIGIVALHGFYKCNTHGAGEVRVFAISFMSTPPAGVPKNIDVRRIKSEPLIQTIFSFTLKLVVLCPCFITDHYTHFINGFIIKCCRQANGLGKRGCQAGTCNTMQCFVPPVISWNFQPFYCR